MPYFVHDCLSVSFIFATKATSLFAMKLLVIVGTFAHVYNPRLLLVEVLGCTLPIVYEKPTCASVCYVPPSLHALVAALLLIFDYVM